MNNKVVLERVILQLAVTDVTDFIYKNMDQGQLTGAVILDLKKAFDTVDAETLLFKLKCLGIDNTEQAWFLNYLINRVQCVSFSGATSQECYVVYPRDQS